MIQQIKESLEKATPGPWAVEANKIMQDKYDRDDYRVLLCNVYRGPRWEADSKLIANAPTYIRYLLDELEKEKIERETLYEALSDRAGTIEYLTGKLEVSHE